jgi:glycosyltransferase involved in cell wall biosynthesis
VTALETPRGMRPKVSVIIPAYNSEAYLSEAIDSVLNQTVVPLDVIVVDDGSADDTPRILEPYRERIRVIVQENKGPSAARNRGIEAAAGDLIAFLDADDVWLPEKLEKQLACLEAHPRAGLVHSAVIRGAPGREETFGSDDPERRIVGNCYHRLFDRCGIMISSVVVRRECLVRVGGFDEEIRRPTTEDYDLWFRIARHHEIAYVEEPLVRYRLHDSNASKQTLAMTEGVLFVVRKALDADPDLARSLGRAVVNNRLFELIFEIGYLHHDAGRTAEARSYFIRALRHRPSNTHTWLLYLVNHLNPGWLSRLRGCKSFLSAFARRRFVRDLRRQHQC